MTVAELIESLKELPQDMEIMVMNPDKDAPMDITLVSRGRWGSAESDDGVDDDDLDPILDSWDDPEFIQDDENGNIAVLVTW